MENAGNILVISTAIVGLASVISASYKSGFISFSVRSYLRDSQPKYEIDNDKVGKFMGVMLLAFLLNVLYGLAVVQSLRDIGAVLLFALLNMAFITYALVYWVLLKEKKKQKRSRQGDHSA